MRLSPNRSVLSMSEGEWQQQECIWRVLSDLGISLAINVRDIISKRLGWPYIPGQSRQEPFVLSYQESPDGSSTFCLLSPWNRAHLRTCTWLPPPRLPFVWRLIHRPSSWGEGSRWSCDLQFHPLRPFSNWSEDVSLSSLTTYPSKPRISVSRQQC